MRRKSTFEDFEKIVNHEEDSEDYGYIKENLYDDRDDDIQNTAADIPAYGSEMFEHEPEETVYRKPVKKVNDNHKKRRKKKKRRQKKNRHIFGKLLVLLQLILSAIFVAGIFYLDMLPVKYGVAAAGVLLLAVVICFVLQFGRGHWVGKIIALLISAILIVASVYVYRTKFTLDDLTKVQTTQVDKIVIAVLKDDEAESVLDMKDYTFGMVTTGDRTKVDLAVGKLESDLGTKIDVKDYDSYNALVDDMYSKKIDAMLYNQAVSDLIGGNHPDFADRVRIIDNLDVETQVYMEDIPDLPITKEPFTIYLSGLDTYGNLEDDTSRSDVNIIACVNPETKQVLLISIPRDAYVEIPGITDGEKDKLTHAGMYGVQYSMDAIETIFDINIPYYARLNFSSMIMLVDALGGIDVDSDISFSTYYLQYTAGTDTWEYYSYNKGINHLNGDHALAFARERMNVSGGDYQRGRNQQKVIQGIIEKMKSPAILTGYTKILDGIKGKFDTNLTSQQIASLVKMQLNDGADWKIINASVYGYSSDEYCASYAGEPLAVEILDDDSVDAVKKAIDQLYAGEVVEKPETTELEKAYSELEESDSEGNNTNSHADAYEYGAEYDLIYGEDSNISYDNE